MQISRALVILALLLAPAFASAAEVNVWDFNNNKVPGDWEAKNLTLTKTPHGLAVNADRKGRFQRENTWESSIHMIEITYASLNETEAWLLFVTRGSKEALGIPLAFNTTDEVIHLRIPVSSYKVWDKHPEEIGLGFNAGAQVLIQDIKFVHLNPFERVFEAWKTFWTFDVFSGHSVNFIWGPLVTDTPAGREQMHAQTNLLPQARSANSIFYAIFIIAALALAIQSIRKKEFRKQAAIIFVIIFGFSWLIYDLRMGSEFINYYSNDKETYWNKPINEREFRERSNFNAFAEEIAPLLAGEDEYMFIPILRNFSAFIRYITYPALPIIELEEGKVPRYWVVYEFPYVTITENQLFMDGKLISPPGKVVERFNDKSFLFEIDK